MLPRNVCADETMEKQRIKAEKRKVLILVLLLARHVALGRAVRVVQYTPLCASATEKRADATGQFKVQALADCDQQPEVELSTKVPCLTITYGKPKLELDKPAD